MLDFVNLILDKSSSFWTLLFGNKSSEQGLFFVMNFKSPTEIIIRRLCSEFGWVLLRVHQDYRRWLWKTATLICGVTVYLYRKWQDRCSPLILEFFFVFLVMVLQVWGEVVSTLRVGDVNATNIREKWNNILISIEESSFEGNSKVVVT